MHTAALTEKVQDWLSHNPSTVKECVHVVWRIVSHTSASKGTWSCSMCDISTMLLAATSPLVWWWGCPSLSGDTLNHLWRLFARLEEGASVLFAVRQKPHSLSSIHLPTQMNMSGVLQGCVYSSGGGFCTVYLQYLYFSVKRSWGWCFHYNLPEKTNSTDQQLLKKKCAGARNFCHLFHTFFWSI